MTYSKFTWIPGTVDQEKADMRAALDHLWAENAGLRAQIAEIRRVVDSWRTKQDLTQD